MLVSCRNCGKSFDKKKAEIKRTKNNYCSKSCKGDFLVKQNDSQFYKKAVFNGDCLEWTKSKNKDGYGIVRYNKKIMLAHRVSYMKSKGDIGESEMVCHKCDNPSCINPDHLFLGSHADNMEDMRVKGRKWAKLTFDDVAAIRESKSTSTELAIIYNVSPRTIRYARDTTRWMPLPEPPNKGL